MILTQEEFDTAYNKALCSFAEMAERELKAETYALRQHCRGMRSERLWLYVYALNTWEHGADDNYITEDQLLKIISKVQIHGI